MQGIKAYPTGSVGWRILLICTEEWMLTFGGLNGYSEGISMSTMKVPPVYGVSAYKIKYKLCVSLDIDLMSNSVTEDLQ